MIRHSVLLMLCCFLGVKGCAPLRDRMIGSILQLLDMVPLVKDTIPDELLAPTETDCERASKAVIEFRATQLFSPVYYEPFCLDDGEFFEVQFMEAMCDYKDLPTLTQWAVDSFGIPLPKSNEKSRAGIFCFAKHMVHPAAAKGCWAVRQLVEEFQYIGLFVPRCKVADSTLYETVQCYNTKEEIGLDWDSLCWCVNVRDGSQMANTTVGPYHEGMCHVFGTPPPRR